MRYLITGATGRTGSGVVGHLRAAGDDVRVLVRDRAKAATLAGADIVDGAFDDPDTLARAFDGVDVAFLSLGSGPDQIRLEKAVIDGAARAGLPHLVKLSVAAAGHDSPSLVCRLHAEIEDHLVASGIPHTLLRPTAYSANLLSAAPAIAATASWSGSAPTGRVTYTDIRDLAEAAAIVLRSPSLHGRGHEWAGPDSLSANEITKLLSDITDREVTYVAVSPEEQATALRGSGVPEWFVDLIVSLDVGAEAGAQYTPSSALGTLLGREPRTVEQFLRANAAAFTGK